jgi:D-3-phosphoglycerate dehydrogenase
MVQQLKHPTDIDALHTLVRQLLAENAALKATIAELEARLQSDSHNSHKPHTPDTLNLLGANELKLMKPTAFVINTSRGRIINEPALITALQENWIAGAGLDTFAVELTPAENILLQLPNVIVTPHTAGTTKESLQKTGINAVTSVFQALEGGEMAKERIVNYQELQMK